MFKTVSFNIFEEQLQEIVYGKNSNVRDSEASPANSKPRLTVQITSQVIVQPLNSQNFTAQLKTNQEKK